MDECILFPSPNWFQASGLSVSRDGWLIYGGPNKSLCILEPLPVNAASIVEGERYRAHVLNKAHLDRIVTVDVSPEWPEKKQILTGSSDGTVKQWILELVNNDYKFRSTQSYDIHQNLKEEVVGAGYSNEVCTLSVGNFGNLVKWDLKSNVVKTYKKFLKGFKPTCMSCSPHMLLHLAVGTKQGIIFVLDLNGSGNILYKVRCQDDEIINISWCPQYEVLLKKTFAGSDKKVSASERMAKIRQETETTSGNPNQSFATKNLPDDSFDESIVAEDDTFDIYTDHDMDLFGPKKFQPKNVLVKIKEKEKTVNDNYLAECLQLKNLISEGTIEKEDDLDNLIDVMNGTRIENDQNNHSDDADSGDSLDTGSSNVNKETNFEINQAEDKQKEHALERNYEEGSNPDEKVNTDDSLEENHFVSEQCEPADNASEVDKNKEGSFHVHRHLLATIGKQGGVRIWSKSGKRIGYCIIIGTNNKNQKVKIPIFPTLLWYKVDCLLIGDGKNQLLQCNPLNIDCKHKLGYQVVHSFHKKSLFCIASDAPKVQIPESKINDESKSKPSNWSVWTCSQDRSMIKYSIETNKKSVYESCGGFLYSIQPCPYDATKISVTVGDGAVRIWDADTTYEDDAKLCAGTVKTFWQNVQGKVLISAWHPTREHLLAFGTGEARVGLIDTSGKHNTRTLTTARDGPVYCLSWGKGDLLYTAGKGTLMAYNALKTEEHPKKIKINLESHVWEIGCINPFVDSLYAVGSTHGGVAIVDEAKSFDILATSYVYTKTIYNVECHPQQTSESNDKSPYKNIIAVSSIDKQNSITLLEYVSNEDGQNQLKTWKVLVGHKNGVLQLAWNPHRDELLVSTSQDTTIRVWDIVQGTCVSVFGCHSNVTVSAAWSPHPQLYDCVISGGHDCTMRLWRYTDFPTENFQGNEKQLITKREKKKLKEKKEGKKAEEVTEGNQAHLLILEKVTTSKKYLFPIISKQMTQTAIRGARKMLQWYLNSKAQCVDGKMETPIFKIDCNFKIGTDVKKEVNKVSSGSNKPLPLEDRDHDHSAEDEVAPIDGTEYGIDFIKMFGSTNDVNEVLDLEMKRHLEAKNLEPWIMLCILRGHMDTMMQFASQNNILCPYLISIAPCVSFKYWKDSTQLYLAQIDRLIAKGEEDKLYVFKSYGGTVYRKAGSLLSIHNIKGAVETFLEAGFYKEAYMLCRTRHMDSVAQEALRKWASAAFKTGSLVISAICYLALGILSEAVNVLSKSEKPEYLSLAADIAKVAGHKTYADQIEERTSNIKLKETGMVNEDCSLEELPTKMELLLRNKTAEDRTVMESNMKSVEAKTLCRESLELSEIVSGLSKSEDPEDLCATAHSATIASQKNKKTYADQIEESASKTEVKENVVDNEDLLNELEERMKLMFRNRVALVKDIVEPAFLEINNEFNKNKDSLDLQELSEIVSAISKSEDPEDVSLTVDLAKLTCPETNE